MGLPLITSNTQGTTNRVEQALKRLVRLDIPSLLHKYGQEGVEVLSAATPQETGETASSWFYEIVISGGSYSIVWKNSHVENGVNIAVIIQYGHGTGTGGYVRGIDYINPAIKPIFEKIKNDVWRAVKSG